MFPLDVILKDFDVDVEQLTENSNFSVHWFPHFYNEVIMVVIHREI